MQLCRRLHSPAQATVIYINPQINPFCTVDFPYPLKKKKDNPTGLVKPWGMVGAAAVWHCCPVLCNWPPLGHSIHSGESYWVVYKELIFILKKKKLVKNPNKSYQSGKKKSYTAFTTKHGAHRERYAYLGQACYRCVLMRLPQKEWGETFQRIQRCVYIYIIYILNTLTFSPPHIFTNPSCSTFRNPLLKYAACTKHLREDNATYKLS